MRTFWSTMLAGLILFASLGCEQGAREETHIFQEAEALYRAGDYDGASVRYETFLETYPRSPFSRTAKLRLASIDREIESVMGTRGMNRPLFIRPTESETAEIIARSREVQEPLGKERPLEEEEAGDGIDLLDGADDEDEEDDDDAPPTPDEGE